MTVIPILITSSVTAHDRRVALTDKDERIFLTIESIKNWHLLAPDSPIVICDGSNFDFTELIREAVPAAKTECLKFQNNIDRVEQYGRGFGEGEIVKHAIQNSYLIKKYGAFAKCTAKLWVNNFNICKSFWNNKFLGKAVFIKERGFSKKIELQYIDTRFYISTIDFYTKYFWSAHEKINKSIGIGLEESFREILLKSGESNILFHIYPLINGVGGGTGKVYRNSWLREWKENRNLKIISDNFRYHHLFQI